MKRFMATIVALCMVIAALGMSGFAADENLIANGGFEDGLALWNTGSAASSLTYADAQEGTKVLQLSSSDSNDWFNVNQVISVNPGTVYNVSFKTKVLSASNQWAVFTKVTGTGDAQIATTNPDVSKTEWQTCEYTFNSAANTSVTFYIGGNVASFYVDDVVITAQETSGGDDNPYGIIIDGGFEDDSAWDIYNTPGATGIQIVDGRAHSGDKSLLVTVEPDMWNDCKQYFTPVESAKYTVKGYIKTNISSPDNAWYGKIMIRSGETELATWQVTDTIPNIPVSEWTEFSFEAELMAGTEYNLRLTGNAGTACTFEYDDISVIKTNEEEPEFDSGIITDGGFENDGSVWDIYNTSGAAGITVANGRAFEGKKSLLVTVEPDMWNDCKQYFTPVETATYIISGMVKTTITNSDNAWLSKVTMRSGSDELVSWQITDTADTLPVSEWTPFSFEAPLEAGTEYNLRVTGNAGAACVFEYDNLAVKAKVQEEEPEPTPGEKYNLYVEMPKNLAVNGNFEDSQTGWDSNYWNNGIASVQTGSAPEGEKYLTLSSSDSNEWFSVSQRTAVEKNTDYTVSFKAKVDSSSNIWGVYSKVADVGGDDIQEPYNPDSNVSGWQDCSYTFNSGDSETITLYIGGNVATFSVDDVCIKKQTGMLISINENDGAVVADAAYAISGNTSSAADIAITVNGTPYNTTSTGADNAFAANLNLLPGKNIIVVSAGDKQVTFTLNRQLISVVEVQKTGDLSSGSISYTFDVHNISGGEKNVVSVLAIYTSDNMLLKLVIDEQSVADAPASVVLSLSDIPSNAAYAKVMFVNNLTKLEPYATEKAE